MLKCHKGLIMEVLKHVGKIHSEVGGPIYLGEAAQQLQVITIRWACGSVSVRHSGPKECGKSDLCVTSYTIFNLAN